MVVMDRVARDIGVLAGRQVQAFDDAELLEQVERAEDRRPADPESPRPRSRDEVGGREVPRSFSDELGHRSAGGSDPVT